MRTAEIEVGGEYEVTVNPRQVQDIGGDPDGIFDHPEFIARVLIGDIDREDHSLRGVKGKVLGIEEGEHGRKLVRVECVARQTIHKEYVEDNPDGTKTEWSGLVVDEDGDPVERDVSFEALIAPMQVKRVWVDAFVEIEMRKLDHVLDYDRDRFADA